jgi:hypothetical protein
VTTPYMSGSLVTSTATFLDDTGSPADPSTITLKYKTGTGDTVTAVYPDSPVTKVSTGVYQAELDTTGFDGPNLQLWTVEWIGTGSVQAIAVSTFQVSPAAL